MKERVSKCAVGMSGRRACEGDQWDEIKGMEVDLEVKRSWGLKSNRVRDEPWRLKILELLLRDGRRWRRHSRHTHIHTQHRCLQWHIQNLGCVYVWAPSLSVTHLAAVCWGAASWFWFLPVGKHPVWLFNRPQNGPHREICVYVHARVCVFVNVLLYLWGLFMF